MLVDGSQIWPGTIPESAIVSDFLDTLLRADGSVPMTGLLDMGGQRITNVGDPVLPTDVALLKNIQAIKWKDSVYAAATVNLLLTGLQPVDGISVPAAKRVLLANQTDQTENGIWITSSGAWSRAADADTSAKLQSAYVSVERGDTLKDHRFSQTQDDVVVGTDAILWVDTGLGAPTSYPSTSNKHMACLATTADHQPACATAISAAPAGHSMIEIEVNGLGQWLANDRSGDCYFSDDGGTTAKTISAVDAGDILYWNQSIAGFALKTTFKISFKYVV